MSEKITNPVLKILVGAGLILMSIWIPPSAFADPLYRPAYDQYDALQAKLELQTSNSMIVFVCMTCLASFQAQKMSTLAQSLSQCEKDFAQVPEKLAKCTSFWQTYLQ